MKNFMVSIYPTKDQNFLTSYIHPLSKKRIRAQFSSIEGANQYKMQVENRFSQPTASNFHELLVEDLVIQFMQENQKSDFMKSKKHIADFIDTFGGFQITELTTGVLKGWLDQIQRENNIKDSSMRGMKCSIDSFFKFLVKKEIISESPLTHIFYRVQAPEIASRTILSKEQIKDLLSSIKAFSPGYLYPLILFISETAAKPNEVVDLDWKQLNFETREIYFPQTPSSRERKLKMSIELSAILESRKKGTGLVFMTYYKEPFTKNKLRRAILEFKVKTASKIPWTPMDLRHSYAVNFLLDGGDMRHLQYILGHNNVFDTKRLYAEVLTKRSQNQIVNPFEIGS